MKHNNLYIYFLIYSTLEKKVLQKKIVPKGKGSIKLYIYVYTQWT